MAWRKHPQPQACAGVGEGEECLYTDVKREADAVLASHASINPDDVMLFLQQASTCTLIVVAFCEETTVRPEVGSQTWTSLASGFTV